MVWGVPVPCAESIPTTPLVWESAQLHKGTWSRLGL